MNISGFVPRAEKPPLVDELQIWVPIAEPNFY